MAVRLLAEATKAIGGNKPTSLLLTIPPFTLQIHYIRETSHWEVPPKITGGNPNEASLLLGREVTSNQW